MKIKDEITFTIRETAAGRIMVSADNAGLRDRPFFRCLAELIRLWLGRAWMRD